MFCPHCGKQLPAGMGAVELPVRGVLDATLPLSRAASGTPTMSQRSRSDMTDADRVYFSSLEVLMLCLDWHGGRDAPIDWNGTHVTLTLADWKALADAAGSTRHVGPPPSEPRVVERQVGPLLRPVPPDPARADFATDEEWEEYRANADALHYQARVEAALQAWHREKPDSSPPTEFGDLLRWFEASARVDGAANAKARAEWKAAQVCTCRGIVENATGNRCPLHRASYNPSTHDADLVERWPTDKELVEWLRARREATGGGTPR